MTLDGLHLTLIGGFGGTITTIIGALIGRWSVNLCQKCGMNELKVELSYLCALVRLLAERAGVTVQDQLALEQQVRQAEKASK